LPVFFILLILIAIAIWYGCSKYYEKIGEKAENSAKHFKENLKDNEKEKKDNE